MANNQQTILVLGHNDKDMPALDTHGSVLRFCLRKLKYIQQGCSGSDGTFSNNLTLTFPIHDVRAALTIAVYLKHLRKNVVLK